MDDLEKRNILDEYCENEMKKLKELCYPKICKIGGISQMDHDDLYSIALDVLRDSVIRFDHIQECKFITFLNNNIQNKFDTFIRDRNREKRSNTKTDENGKLIFIPNISIDAAAEAGVNICEKIDSGYHIEDELPEEIGFLFNEKIEKYLGRLSKTQRKIVILLAKGCLKDEIADLLQISKKEYADNMLGIRAFENVRVLY